MRFPFSVVQFVLAAALTSYAHAATRPALLEKLNTVHGSGYGRALATDGSQLILGSPDYVSSDKVEVFVKNGSGDDVIADSTIFPPVDAPSDMRSFGRAVTIDGNLAAVSSLGNNRGYVTLYRRDAFAAGRWIGFKTLTETDLGFGARLDLSGLTLAVGIQQSGATGKIQIRSASTGGSGQWGIIKTLETPRPSGGGIIFVGPDEFGMRFDLSGDTLVASIGHESASSIGNNTFDNAGTFVFGASAGGAGNWGLTQSFSALDLGANWVGGAVALEGNRLIFTGTLNGNRAVWFYDKSGSSWTQADTFEIPAATAPLPAGSFGANVGIYGDVAMASYFDNFAPPAVRHVVILFARDGSGWRILRSRSSGTILDDPRGDDSTTLQNVLPLGAAALGDGLLAFNAAALSGLGPAQPGLVSVYLQDIGGANQWGNLRELYPAVGRSPEFGAAIAAAGDYLVVGDPGDDEIATDSGAVYWFQRRRIQGLESWRLLDKIKPAAPGAGARFGASVDIETDPYVQIAIGSPNLDNTGGFYIYRSGSSNASINGIALRISATGLRSGSRLGASVALTDSFIAAGDPIDAGAFGAAGAVHIYRRIGNGYSADATLRGEGMISGVGAFGHSISMDGEFLAAGSPADARGGSVHVYRRGSTRWDFVREINLDQSSNVRFGEAVSLRGNILVAGAPVVGSGRGEVRIFLQEITEGGAPSWGEALRLFAPSTSGGFGSSIATDGSNLLVGDPSDSTRSPSEGAAYLYRVRPGSGSRTWEYQARLRGDVPAANYGFGGAVAVSGIHLAATSLNDDAITNDHGAAYIFRAGAYETWVLANALPSGEAATYDDPDRDGQTNLEEFGYGSDPKNGSSLGTIEITRRAYSGGRYRINTASVAKPPYSTDGLTRTFELSSSLRNFRAPAPSRIDILEDSATRYTEIYDSLTLTPPGALPNEFARIRFGYPE